MKMLEISKEEFEDFAKDYSYYNYLQTENYGITMQTFGYDYSFIAYTNNDDEMLAAGMFLIKELNKSYKYAYCPGGYLIDYNNSDLLRRFTNNLKKYYRSKKVIFLKTNPSIDIAKIDQFSDYETNPNSNKDIIEILKKYGYKKRKELEPLQLMEPKLHGVIDLKNYSKNKLDKEIINKLESIENKGIEIESTSIDKIELFYDFIKENDDKGIDFYKNMYNAFINDNQIDLLLVKVNYEKYLVSAKKKAEEEQIKNEELNKKLPSNMTERALTEKIESDKKLESYKKDVVEATNGLSKNGETYIAGALVIKFKNKITIIAAGVDKTTELNQDYYLYDRIFNMYKNEYEIADIGAIANNFEKSSIYNEANSFKLAFKPVILETIGEFDLIVSELRFKIAEKNNLLSNEFSKKKNI